jgi:hypothetical protein
MLLRARRVVRGTALVAACALAATASPLALGQAPLVLQLTPAADATIFGEQTGGPAADGLADGAGPNVWTSVLASGVTRRALLRFDLGALPPGAQVMSVSLSLFQVRARDSHAVQLHRVLASWSEGPANPGGTGAGVPAQAGDSTWSHRRWPDLLWAQRGGDFVATASASTLVGGGTGVFTWSSTPQLVADVQGWLAQPGSNHGWILIGDDQGLQNAKRFSSREDVPAGRPTLTITYQPLPEREGDVPLPPWALALLGASVGAVLMRRSRSRPTNERNPSR